MATFEQIKEVNETIKTTNIKGKDYAEVNQRIKAFRMIYPDGSISTDLISNEDGVCVFKAMVCNESGQVLGTGYAYEKEGSSFINKTSYIENCETSAVGRALGMCGIGIDTSVSSYEEVANAVQQQSDLKTATKSEKEIFLKRCEQLGVDYKAILKQVGVNGQMTKEQHGKALIILKEIEESRNEQSK